YEHTSCRRIARVSYVLVIHLRQSAHTLLRGCFSGSRTQAGARRVFGSEQVAELRLLREQVPSVFHSWLRHERHALDDAQRIALERSELRGVVAHQANGRQTQEREDLRSDVVAARVDWQPELQVGFDGVAPFVLEAIRMKLVD